MLNKEQFHKAYISKESFLHFLQIMFLVAQATFPGPSATQAPKM